MGRETEVLRVMKGDNNQFSTLHSLDSPYSSALHLWPWLAAAAASPGEEFRPATRAFTCSIDEPNNESIMNLNLQAMFEWRTI